MYFCESVSNFFIIIIINKIDPGHLVNYFTYMFHSGIDSIEIKKVDVGVQFNYASLETGRFNNYIIN